MLPINSQKSQFSCFILDGDLTALPMAPFTTEEDKPKLQDPAVSKAVYKRGGSGKHWILLSV